MPDWAIAVAVIVGTLLGAGIAEFRHWVERKERYQVITFEKRLEAHQQAFGLCLKVSFLCEEALKNSSEYPKEFADAVSKAMEWWGNNCLYLDEDSREAMLDALEGVTDIVAKQDESSITDYHKSVSKKVAKALARIVEGVGAKYIPEIEKLESLKRR